MNAIQHTPSCFINQPCALHIAFDKCFYISDVVVVKPLYNAFLIHKEQVAFQVHVLRLTIKFGYWGTLGEFMGCSLVKSDFFRALQYKVDSIVRPDVTFIQAYVCASGYR